MGRLLKAFFFKLSRDLTFRITLIIGAVMAVAISLLYFGMQKFLLDELGGGVEGVKLVCGQMMFTTSMSPVQNYGLVIPINLIIFTCLEFSQGTIRNKIIAGNSKFKIYASLYVTGLVFALSLLSVYILICTGFGAIFGGFNLKDNVFNVLGMSLSGATGVRYTVEYMLKMALICVLTYSFIVSATIFFAALFRSIGPCIPVIIILLLALYYAVSISQAVALFLEEDKAETLLNVFRIIDPFYAISASESEGAEPIYHQINDEVMIEYQYYITKMNDVTFYAGIGNNLIYSALFFGFGSLIFAKRDIK